MLTPLAAAAVAVLSLAQQSDTTVAVPRGARLEVDNFAGAVTVRTWDRDAVRLQGTHAEGDVLSVDLEEGVLSVSTEREMGVPVDTRLDITAPRAMPVEVSGVRTDVTVEGSAGEVVIETVEGAVRLNGGAGIVSLSSVQGPVHVQGARGRIELSSVNEAITANAVSGDLTAETVNGGIRIDRADLESVEATTVNGTVAYSGGVSEGGLYRFATHNGDVTVTVPEATNAHVAVSTFQGEFESDFGVQLSEGRHSRDVSFVLGSGGARIEMESFQGLMRLLRAGPRPAGESVRAAPQPAPPAPRVPRAPRAPEAPPAPRPPQP